MSSTKGSTTYVLYTDNSVNAGTNKAEINQVIRDIQHTKLDTKVEGDIQYFLGTEDRSIH